VERLRVCLAQDKASKSRKIQTRCPIVRVPPNLSAGGGIDLI